MATSISTKRTRKTSTKPGKIVRSAKPAARKAAKPARVLTEVAPSVSDTTIFKLYVAAGGLCSFPGCPEYLMAEPLTTRPARLGNVAHIVAEKKDGTRGGDPLPMNKRADIENLILLCSMHHAFVDKKEQESAYPAQLLREFKRVHELQIREATSTARNEKTHAIRLVGQIRGHVVGLSDVEIRTAVFAHECRHVESIIDIDLGAVLDGADASYLKIGKDKINAELTRRILPQLEDHTIKRLSIFALSRIPLICHLGYELGDKVPSVLYQKHRDDGEGWAWPDDPGDAIDFEIIEHGARDTKVPALLASVSGGDVEKVRRATAADRVLEIRPIGVAPSRTLLRSPKTLENFRDAYHRALSKIEHEFPGTTSVDYFLGVPAPAALICGRDVLRDVVPRVVVFDLVDGAYVPATVLETRTKPTSDRSI